MVSLSQLNQHVLLATQILVAAKFRTFRICARSLPLLQKTPSASSEEAFRVFGKSLPRLRKKPPNSRKKLSILRKKSSDLWKRSRRKRNSEKRFQRMESFF